MKGMVDSRKRTVGKMEEAMEGLVLLIVGGMVGGRKRTVGKLFVRVLEGLVVGGFLVLSSNNREN